MKLKFEIFGVPMRAEQKKLEVLEKKIEKSDSDYTTLDARWRGKKKVVKKLEKEVKALKKKHSAGAKVKLALRKRELKAEKNLEKDLKSEKDKLYVAIGELVHDWEETMKIFYDTPGPFMSRFFNFLKLCKIRKNLKMIKGVEAFEFFRRYDEFSQLWSPIIFTNDSGKKISIGSEFYSHRVKKFFCKLNEMNQIVGPVTCNYVKIKH